MAESTVTAETLVKELGLVPHPEGGFFLETHRCGSTPMSSKGETDLKVPDEDLVLTNRTNRRPDGDGRRNALTSIYWMPTGTSPKLYLTINISDAVHYYHGGEPFEYILVDPQAKKTQRVVLGANVLAGHRFQLPVKGGIWKCGHLLVDPTADPSSSKESYCLIGEALGPGFDFHDFTWVTAKMVKEMVPDLWKTLQPFLHDKTAEKNSLSKDGNNNSKTAFSEEWKSYYNISY